MSFIEFVCPLFLYLVHCVPPSPFQELFGSEHLPKRNTLRGHARKPQKNENKQKHLSNPRRGCCDLIRGPWRAGGDVAVSNGHPRPTQFLTCFRGDRRRQHHTPLCAPSVSEFGTNPVLAARACQNEQRERFRRFLDGPALYANAVATLHKTVATGFDMMRRRLESIEASLGGAFICRVMLLNAFYSGHQHLPRLVIFF